MISQLVTWIALPNGVDADPSRLRLSVFVAPRLRTDEAETLAPFADFLDWPARIADPGASLAVELADGTVVPATVATHAPSSPLWQALFSAATPLQPFVFDDFADRPIVTYSVQAVRAGLQAIYTTIAAASPDELPRLLSVANAEPPVRGLVDLAAGLQAVRRGRLFEGVESDEGLRARIEAVLDAATATAAQTRASEARGGPLLEPLPGDGSLGRELERAVLFHRRPPWEPVEIPSEGAADRFRAEFDFHRIVAALGDHPALLRRLGLVVDLTVPAAAIPVAPPNEPLLVRIRPTWQSGLTAGQSADRTPWTACVHQDVGGTTIFVAAPRVPPADNVALAGLMPLPEASFELEHGDVDGAALKAVGFAATLQRAANADAESLTPFGGPDAAGLPALRTGGVSLVQTGRAAAVQSDFGTSLVQSGAIDGGADLTLYQEDVTRGQRLDVWDGRTGTWHSLHDRVVHYAVAELAEPLPPIADEGFVELSVAAPPTPPGTPPDPNAPLYLHESLATWDGWSLSVPRPGKSISRDPRAPSPDAPETQPERAPNEPLTSAGLAIEVDPPQGTLPRLRFGIGYRFRARLVDLAGNGPTPDEADARLALPSMSAASLPSTRVSVHRRFEPVAAPAVVPRARFAEGESILRLVVRSNADLTSAAWADQLNASPLVAGGGHPPYAAVAERHIVAPKAALQQVELHGALDDVIGSHGPPDAAQVAAIQAAYELARREKGSIDDPSLPSVEIVDVSPDPARPQRYAVHTEAQLALPYLPDPFATGAIFFGLPGRPADQPLAIDFERPSWHEGSPLRLQLAGGSGPPVWDPGARVLTVLLPQASRATVRVASAFGGDLGTMGVMQWCRETLSAADNERVVGAAKANRCWLITPWHELELVHAVQQPLVQPSFEAFEVFRARGATYADLFGIVGLDAPSTEKIDLVGTWAETVDDLQNLGPEQRNGETVIFDLSLETAATGRLDADPHEVPYSLRDRKLVSFSTPAAAERGLALPLAHHFGDTHYRRVRYRVVATTPFREYFPAEFARAPAPGEADMLSLASADHEVDILSTAPPAAPVPLYAVPAAAWERAGLGSEPTSRRTGGTIRIYLARGWYSSGDGERLGVVIGPSPITARSLDYPFVSLIGVDPVRAGGTVQALRPESFRNAAGIVPRATLLETATPMRLVVFDPVFDPTTHRWTCDIDLDTEDAYFPFVRLALVRYQANALPGCEVSAVVVSDLIQTLPDRALTVTRSAANPTILEVTLVGPSYSAIAGPDGVRADDAVLGRVVARLETRDPGIESELLAWQPVAGSEVELARALNGSVATWSGQLDTQPVAGSYRVAVVEEDRLIADEQTPGGIASRVVYAEFVQL